MRHAPIGMALVTADGRFLEVNAALCRMLGRDEVVLRQLLIRDVTHPDDLAESLHLVEEMVAGQREACQLEKRYLHADGHLIWGEVSVSCLQSGGRCLFIVQIVDVSEARRRQPILTDQEEQYRLLAENAADVVCRLDLEGRILWVSPSLTAALGWLPEDWIGEIGTQFLEHGGEVKHYLNNLNAQQRGEGSRLARDQARAKDGRLHWIELHASPYVNSRGEVDGIVASFRLIDAAVAAERALRTSEARYRLLAENARDVIWTIEPDGRFSYVSPSVQLLRGFSPEETMGQSMEQILTSESLKRYQLYLQHLQDDLLAGRPPLSFRAELEYYCHGGSTIWAEVMALPVVDDRGYLQQLMGVSRDISERKQLETELMAANQQLQALATTDELTGISNRRHLEASLKQAMERSNRYGEPLTLILCDIDHFKAVNDRLGHQVGDQVLITFCQRIRRQLRSSDGFGRWGGEEFLILLPQTDLGSACILAEKLRLVVAADPFAEVGTVTASFGVAQRHVQESAMAWLRRADDCLYTAKDEGRNRVVSA